MTSLKRRIIDYPEGHYWALYGSRGVVEFMADTEYPLLAVVGMHSLRPRQHAVTHEHCLFLEGGCHVEDSDSGGTFIATEWENAGFDDEVIWRWLAEYYAETFVIGSAAGGG